MSIAIMKYAFFKEIIKDLILGKIVINDLIKE